MKIKNGWSNISRKWCIYPEFFITEDTKKQTEDTRKQIKDIRKQIEKNKKIIEEILKVIAQLKKEAILFEKLQKEKIKKEYEKRKKYKEKVSVYAQKRRTMKKKLIANLTPKEWSKAQDFFDNKCAYCGKSNGPLTQDHFVPLSKGGPYTAGNIIPACRSCNSSKGPKEFNHWYAKYKYYDKSRKEKINKYFELIKQAKAQNNLP